MRTVTGRGVRCGGRKKESPASKRPAGQVKGQGGLNANACGGGGKNNEESTSSEKADVAGRQIG